MQLWWTNRPFHEVSKGGSRYILPKTKMLVFNNKHSLCNYTRYRSMVPSKRYPMGNSVTRRQWIDSVRDLTGRFPWIFSIPLLLLDRDVATIFGIGQAHPLLQFLVQLAVHLLVIWILKALVTVRFRATWFYFDTRPPLLRVPSSSNWPRPAANFFNDQEPNAWNS